MDENYAAQPPPPPPQGDEKRNLIVNYLPNMMTSQAFRNMFSPFGEIESSRVVFDKLTGMGLGYGFVKFKSEDAAAMAITSLNGQQIENKTLKVAYAQKPGAAVAAEQPPNVYVAHLEKSVTQEELEKMFEPYGTIIETKLLTDANTGESRGVGFVRYETKEQAQAAIEYLNNYQLEGAANPLVVKFSDSKAEKKRKRGAGGVGFYNQLRFDPIAAALAAQHGVAVPTATALPAEDYSRIYAASGYPSLPAASGYSSLPAAGAQVQTFCLFVYNLPAASDDSYLYRLFAPYGAIQSVKAVTDPTTDVCKGFGFVHFVKLEEAQQAIMALSGSEIGGKYLQVSFKTPKKMY